jgi:hypothetical protein
VSDELAGLTEAIRHKLSRSDTVTFSAGAAVAAVSQQPGTPYSTSAFPFVEGSYATVWGDKRADVLALYLRYFPYMNVTTGSVLATFSAEARVMHQIRPDLSLQGSAIVTQSYPQSDPSAATYVRGGVVLDYAVSKRVDLGIGEGWLWQQGQGAVASLVSAYGLLSVTVREPTLHF